LSTARRKASAGTEGKSDLVVTVEPLAAGSGIEVLVGGTEQGPLAEQVRRVVEDFGLTDIRMVLEDRPVPPWVLGARVEAALRRAGWDGEASLVPVAPLTPVFEPRLRRTRLYLPGNNARILEKGPDAGADAVILDLEDSVSPAEKDAARGLVRWALAHLDFGAHERIVRINALTSPYGKDDLKAVVPLGAETILLPKSEVPEDIVVADRLLAGLEQEAGLSHGAVKLMPLIETALGVVNAYPIATCCKRVVALCFGAEDFTADMGVKRTREGKETLFARSQIVMAAKAAQVMALDTVFSDLDDMEGLVRETRESIGLGFDGKGVIHPKQIEPIHQLFYPTEEEIKHARKVMAALEEAQGRGSGVAALGRKMIDEPVAARARRVLDLAKLIKASESHANKH
jgi:citrate lyase subunit beta/citryl-CoA lyase